MKIRFFNTSFISCSNYANVRCYYHLELNLTFKWNFIHYIYHRPQCALAIISNIWNEWLFHHVSSMLALSRHQHRKVSNKMLASHLLGGALCWFIFISLKKQLLFFFGLKISFAKCHNCLCCDLNNDDSSIEMDRNDIFKIAYFSCSINKNTFTLFCLAVGWVNRWLDCKESMQLSYCPLISALLVLSLLERE